MSAQNGRESSHEVAPGLNAFRLTRAELAAAEARRGQQRDSSPSLMLTVGRGPLHVTSRLVLVERGAGGRLTHNVLRRFDWDPDQVTHRLLVEWAHRTCATWLEEQDALLRAAQG